MSRKFTYKAWQTRQWNLKNGQVEVIQEATDTVPEKPVAVEPKPGKRPRQIRAAHDALERNARRIG